MIYELYSKRMKKEKGEVNDIYQYDELPKKLRVQIAHILSSAILRFKYDSIWDEIKCIMCKEMGLFQLGDDDYTCAEEECLDYLLQHENIEEVLDIIELAIVFIKENHIVINDRVTGKVEFPEQIINEINYRFRENNVGYEFVGNQIIRIDRKLIHSEVIKPAINLLYEEKFSGANDEFLKAHEYYRKKEYKNSILYAGKAFESAMKTVCEEMQYTYNKNKDTANKLIEILCENEFIPMSLKNHFQGLDKVLTGLKTSLNSGLPTLRNKKAGHGQGDEVVYVPEQFVTYAINLAATNIVLLVDLYKNNK
ncbi:MAG: hypothetical protein E7214_10175 [Clostridium sp.]|nr:hypothetical protein [Clostridium sp.]